MRGEGCHVGDHTGHANRLRFHIRPQRCLPVIGRGAIRTRGPATAKGAEAFHARFGVRALETKPAAASEDFSIFGRSWGVPYVFWFVGGTDPAVYEQHRQAGTVKGIPSNHSPRYAPVLDPTLRTGLEAMLAAASAWLCARDASASP